MKVWSSPKIWPWLSMNKEGNKYQKGSISLVVSLLFVVFSTLGLGLLYFSQIYLKMSAYKKNSILLDYASENGVKQGLDHLLTLLSQPSFPLILSSEEAGELRDDAAGGGLKLIKKILGSQFSLKTSAGWEKLSWQYNFNFYLKQGKDKKDYFYALYRAIISSRGKLANFKPERVSSLECQMEVLAGYLPLPLIPLLIDKKLSPEQKANFAQDHQVEIKLPEKRKPFFPIYFSDQQLLPQQADSQLLKALKIKLFYPQDLSPAKLRIALGLEVSDQPIPDGVYLIKDDLGLGGIFVQGNLQEMIMAIEGDFQIISFLLEQGKWLLKFSPKEGKTFFSTPTENCTYDLIPLGIIIVNGKIYSLGGGIINNSGEIELSPDEKIPAVLQGVNLTIICSDEITISSHLIQQGIKWQESVPYLKDSSSQLTIMATGKDFLEDKEKAGKIMIDRDSPKNVEIQASLIASGQGLSIQGENKVVNIEGSLQTSALSLDKNELKIIFDDRLFNYEQLQDAPRTKRPVLYLASFQPLTWKEFEEEDK